MYESEYNNHDYMFKRPVPLELPKVDGWKEVPIKEKGEPMVSLGLFGEYNDIFSNATYAGEREDSPYEPDSWIPPVLVRKSVAESLRNAEIYLPINWHIVVFDGWRDYSTQEALYNQFYNELKSKRPYLSAEQLSTETQKFVSLPSDDNARPSPHNTGGTVDLAIFRLPKDVDNEYHALTAQMGPLEFPKYYQTEMRRDSLIRRYGQLLNFGTPFDHGGFLSNLCVYEKMPESDLTDSQLEARNNRRMLYNTMRFVGLESYPEEWWHYNSSKTQMGAKAAYKSWAEMGAALPSSENKIRAALRDILMKKVKHRDLRSINFPMAEAIKPI